MSLSTRKPRAFVSYRHDEVDGDYESNRAHRSWVEGFIESLRQLGIEAIWDRDLNEVMRKHSALDSRELPLCAEISRALPAICDAFVAIITPGYLFRLGVVDGVHEKSVEYGVIHEEWQGALQVANMNVVDLVPVVRLGESHKLNLTELSPYIFRHGLIDMRGDEPKTREQGLQRIHRKRRPAAVLTVRA